MKKERLRNNFENFIPKKAVNTFILRNPLKRKRKGKYGNMLFSDRRDFRNPSKPSTIDDCFNGFNVNGPLNYHTSFSVNDS